MLSLVLDRVVGRSSTELDTLVQAYNAHAPEIFRVLRRLGVADSAVEDAVQDVFAVAWRRRDSFEGRSSQRTWLYGIARKVARDYRRKRQRATRETPDLEALSGGADPGTHSEAVEAARLVDAALKQMSEVLREVFVLVEIEQLTAPEAAEILSVPLNTIYSRIRLARQQFRKLIDPVLAAAAVVP
jgi:RNA polymerase sigma-70 factor (ECF subfamily)